MYKIYNLDSCLRVSSTPTPEAITTLSPATEADFPPVAKLLKILENSKAIDLIYHTPDDFMRYLCGQIRVIEAAGGVVTDPRGRLLMIRRWERWDLPKGWVEKGESLWQAALREVGEECGLQGIDLGEPLMQTWHLYSFQGSPALKHTHWFSMQYNGSQEPVPQREEQITLARWVAPEELAANVSESYGNIRDVVEAWQNYIRK